MHDRHIPNVIPCSVQLVARPNHARNVIQPLSGIHDFVRSVHLDARMNHSQNVIHHLSGIHDFVQQVARYGSIIPHRSVHLDARMNHSQTLFITFRVFTISCNKLHATGENDLTSVRDSRFRATSCTLRGIIVINIAGILLLILQNHSRIFRIQNALLSRWCRFLWQCQKCVCDVD